MCDTRRTVLAVQNFTTDKYMVYAFPIVEYNTKCLSIDKQFYNYI